MTDTLQQELRYAADQCERFGVDVAAKQYRQAADALDREAGEIARIKSAAESLARGTLRQAATIAAQAAEIERLRADAERYHHIREHGEPDEGMAYRPDWAPGMYDAAVDAARAALQAGKAVTP